MKAFKKIAAVFAAAAMALSLAACSGGNNDGSSAADSGNSAAAGSFRTVDEIKNSGKITIGVFSDKNPFGYVDNNGEFQGYDVYFAKRIAEDLGVELELHPLRLQAVLSSLKLQRSI